MSEEVKNIVKELREEFQFMLAHKDSSLIDKNEILHFWYVIKAIARGLKMPYDELRKMIAE